MFLFALAMPFFISKHILFKLYTLIMQFSASTNESNRVLMGKITTWDKSNNVLGTPVPFGMYLYTDNFNPDSIY